MASTSASDILFQSLMAVEPDVSARNVRVAAKLSSARRHNVARDDAHGGGGSGAFDDSDSDIDVHDRTSMKVRAHKMVGRKLKVKQ